MSLRLRIALAAICFVAFPDSAGARLLAQDKDSGAFPVISIYSKGLVNPKAVRVVVDASPKAPITGEVGLVCFGGPNLEKERDSSRRYNDRDGHFVFKGKPSLAAAVECSVKLSATYKNGDAGQLTAKITGTSKPK